MSLVDMWLELTEHLTPETIGSPVDFFKEHEAIMGIIHDAREGPPSVRLPMGSSRSLVNCDRVSERSLSSDDAYMEYEMELVRRRKDLLEEEQRAKAQKTPAAVATQRT
ncbi:hypothetical protein C8Q77DRAFT_1161105 [Trametes polyzona]|nr:hypothetical protein C8Q77DRAFT_1161105 [Trametes polyzona]